MGRAEKIWSADRRNKICCFQDSAAVDLLESEHCEEKTTRDVQYLTMTDRYYSHQDCVNLGLQHRKIPLRGQGSLPSEEEVEQFYETVGEFLDAQEDGLVGVHSTGYKRPGLLICRYMIEMLEYDPEEAVQAYNDASGYNIDQESYLTYLHTRAWEVDN